MVEQYYISNKLKLQNSASNYWRFCWNEMGVMKTLVVIFNDLFSKRQATFSNFILLIYVHEKIFYVCENRQIFETYIAQHFKYNLSLKPFLIMYCEIYSQFLFYIRK